MTSEQIEEAESIFVRTEYICMPSRSVQLRLDVSAVQCVVVRLGVASAKLRVADSRRVGGLLRARLPTQPELQLVAVRPSLYYK